MDGGTRTLSILSAIALGGKYVTLHSRQFTLKFSKRNQKWKVGK